MDGISLFVGIALGVIISIVAVTGYILQQRYQRRRRRKHLEMSVQAVKVRAREMQDIPPPAIIYGNYQSPIINEPSAHSSTKLAPSRTPVNSLQVPKSPSRSPLRTMHSMPTISSPRVPQRPSPSVSPQRLAPPPLPAPHPPPPQAPPPIPPQELPCQSPKPSPRPPPPPCRTPQSFRTPYPLQPPQPQPTRVDELVSPLQPSRTDELVSPLKPSLSIRTNRTYATDYASTIFEGGNNLYALNSPALPSPPAQSFPRRALSRVTGQYVLESPVLPYHVQIVPERR